jgi:hypothetical protein
MNQLARAGFKRNAQQQVNGVIRTQLLKRSYSSFFSSKGGGRYFNANGKPVNGGERVPANTGKAQAQQQQGEGQAPAVGEPTKSAPEQQTKKVQAESVIQQPTTTLPPPPPHSHLAPRDLQLHQFFSLHRPLLSLSAPSIFQPPSVFTTKPSSQAAPWEEDEESEDEGRSDGAALMLWHSLINSKLRSSMDFHSALANLGSLESKDMQRAVEKETNKVRISMDSTKRKRRKKMSKHKLKKRRRVSGPYFCWKEHRTH